MDARGITPHIQPNNSVDAQSRRAELNAARERIRELFKNKVAAVLEEKLFRRLWDGVHVFVRCHLCHDPHEVRCKANNWRSLMGLMGDCENCGGHVPVETAFLDGENTDIEVIWPADSEEEVLDQLACVASFDPRGERNPSAVSRGRLSEPAPAALADAIQNDQIETVKQLVTIKNVDSVVRSGMTSLCYASFLGKPAMVTTLLKCKANVEATGLYCSRALQYAASGKNKGVVAILLEAKASVNAANVNGETALFAACEAGEPDISKMLINSQADVGKTNTIKRTALHAAARAGNAQVVQLLIDHNAAVNREDVFGKTPLEDTFHSNHMQGARSFWTMGRAC